MIDNFDELLNKAYNLHISNKLQEAKIIYENLLEVYFDNNNLLNLYAQLLVNLKDYENALKYFTVLNSRIKDNSVIINTAKVYMLMNNYQSAIDTLKISDNSDVAVLNLLASCYLKLEKYNEAIVYYEKIVSLDDKNIVNLYNYSYCLAKCERYEDSLKPILTAYSLNSQDVDILKHLAMIYEKLNDSENEFKYLSILAAIVPDINIFEKCALLAKDLGNTDLALAYFNEILKLDSENLTAVTNIAMIYEDIDKSVSIELYKEIIEKEGASEFYLLRLFTLYNEMHSYVEALEQAKALLKLDDNNFSYYHLCAMCLYNLYKYDKAKEYYQKALKISPEVEYLWVYYARVLAALKEDGEAIKILSEHMNANSAKRDYLELILRNKDFSSVKELYYSEHSRSHEVDYIAEKANSSFHKYGLKNKFNITEQEFNKNILEHAKFSKSVFNKEYLKKAFKFPINTNDRLLIYSLHGAGDFIMSLRYLEEVKKLYKDIILSVSDNLFDIVKYNFPDFNIVSSNTFISESDYDVSIPIFCLNYLLNSDFDSIPFTSGYLKVDESIINKAKNEYDFLNTDKRKIGIFWIGNPSILVNRAAKLSDFLPLINNKNNMIYSFQLNYFDDNFAEISKSDNFIDLSPYIKNYTDTAAFLKNIDVLVTIDTSIAHLSGALGIKTYLMLPFEAEWRWFFDEKRSSWYDSIEIFRQKNPNNWAEVISEIEKELNNGK